MSIGTSLSVFRQLWREDSQLAALGARHGTLLRLHYGGRWAARLGFRPRLHRIYLRQCGHSIQVELSALYSGAFKGVFLDQEYDCSKMLTDKPLRILDLGANIGMGAIHLACQFPDSEIVCVEPDTRNLDLLERNLKANSVRASVISMAVGANSGKLGLRFGDDPTCSALESSPMHQLQDTAVVDVITIPELLRRIGWAGVDLLKMDIEGSEDEVLSINNEWLAQVGALILEIHPNTTAERIARYLKPYNFKLQRVGTGREPVYFAARS